MTVRRGIAAGLFVCAIFGVAIVQGARAMAQRSEREGRSRDLAVAIAEGRYQRPIFPAVDVTKNVAYRNTVNHAGKPVTLALDVYSPAGDDNHSRAAVIWMHSGGFIAGDKLEMAEYATDLAKRGYVAVSINYRQRPHMQWFDTRQRAAAAEDAFVDAAAAVDFLRLHARDYGIDPTLIFASGYSAGAITAFDLAYPTTGSTLPPIAGAVSIAGYTNGPPRPGRPPVLVFHGTADPMVPYRQDAESCEGAIGVGDRCDMVTFPDGGHDIGIKDKAQITDRIATFLTQVIANSE